MTGRIENKEKNQGIFRKLKILLRRNRLGEMMVMNGCLTPYELRYALARQKKEGLCLGRVLLQEEMITRRTLYNTLAQQWSLRGLAACMTLTIAFSGFGAKSTRADPIKDVPAQMSLVSAANNAFSPVHTYPALFGSEERRSVNLEPFTKWSGMFERFEQAMTQPQGQEVIRQWQKDLRGLEGKSLKVMAKGVNELANAQKYVVDSRNWGKSDYWETPVEFFTRGGDCEDFAIAKYISLRALGVPEERLRVAIVHDKQKNIPHAVLIVYTEKGEALILDNQVDHVRASSQISRYRPIFSINRQAWWLHTKPKSTILASLVD